MYDTTQWGPSGPPTQLIFMALVVAIAAGGFFVRKWLAQHQAPDTDMTPVLLGYFTRGNDIMNAQKSQLPNVSGGAIRSTLVTLPRHREPQQISDGQMFIGGGMPVSQPNGSLSTGEVATNAFTTLIMVDLPFQSKLHLLAIAKDTPLDKLNPTFGNSVMEPVELEGNYSDFFTLYADHEEQVQARYILDPAAMAFTIDFCKKYHWEIINDSLYFAAKDALPDDDTITKFINEIRPAVEIPIDPNARTRQSQPERAQTTDNTRPLESQPSPFTCPICQTQLLRYRYGDECPNGHGQLVSGEQLTELRDGSQTFSGQAEPEVPQEHQIINCPACGNSMQPIAYAGSKVIIDSCTHCPYRWLDAGEIEHILNLATRV